MAHTEIYERLQLIFRRSTALPQLPGSAMRLLKALDSDYYNGTIVERVVTSDPALAASLIRIASSALYGGVQIHTIRQAILRVGERSIRSLALSLAIQSMARTGMRNLKFDAVRYSRHSLYVGMMASALHKRVAANSGKLSWTPEEVLAAGILHELHFGILSRVSPMIFDRTVQFAETEAISLDDAFERLFGGPAHLLAQAALRAWGMPEFFIEALGAMYEDPEDGEFLDNATLRAAHALSYREGHGLEEWLESPEYPLDASFVPEGDELQELNVTVKAEALEFIETTMALAA